ncbi:hypothetical protein [Paenibacillus sp. FSL R5-0345]|uniref:hypothetical protein n=1 Tax=Paenibacillus sp. FSL R5-0345 TaxID=1536770 RepID=UPI000A63716C|nr:hypothetical protein [Paenibacillus sp. FSL R5-0345]
MFSFRLTLSILHCPAVKNVELPLIYRGLSHRERREIAQQAKGIIRIQNGNLV